MQRWFIVGCLLAITPSLAKAQWQFRRPITISSTGTALTNFQVPITLTTGTFDYSRTQSDGADLRFSTDINGASFDVSHWVESYNTGGTSTIWIKVSSIPAAGGTTVYLFYGNASATDASDGSAVFDFFDDFSGSSLDATKWNIILNNGTVSVSGGTLTMSRPAGNNFIQLRTVNTFNAPLRMGYRMQVLNINQHYFSSIAMGPVGGTRASLGYALLNNFESALYTGTPIGPPRTFTHPSSDGDTIDDPEGNVWFTDTFSVPDGSGFLSRQLNSNTVETSTRYQGGTSGPIDLFGTSPALGFGFGASTLVDYFYTRQYSATEPSATLGAEDGLLPVELVAFRAVFSEANLTLTWQTVSETNNAGFEVQEQQGQHEAAWQSLGFIAGIGTTVEAQEYAYAIPQPTPGTHVYRLKQIDFDGTVAYSPEVRVEVPLHTSMYLSAPAPNPFQSTTAFTLTIAQSQRVTVNVYNMVGRHVETLFEGIGAASQPQELRFSAGSLPTGIYIVRVQGEAFTTHRQVVLVR